MSNILFLDHYKTSMVDAMKRRYIEATLDYLGVKELESNSDFNTPKDSLNTAGYVFIGKILDGYTADEALKELSSNKALKAYYKIFYDIYTTANPDMKPLVQNVKNYKGQLWGKDHKLTL